MNAVITFMEPFPIGLPMTQASAVVLRRKAKGQSAESLPVVAGERGA